MPRHEATVLTYRPILKITSSLEKDNSKKTDIYGIHSIGGTKHRWVFSLKKSRNLKQYKYNWQVDMEKLLTSFSSNGN